ncbi:DUF7344 domain-containing protein [Natronococcus jeotgali]|uniref:DUF7344 domain-containing protein n=1 Tax=Natronococcus jeotgali TaxID=413812 RepID=UPI000A074D56|nr:hypothetical protein [Natronococcus jeotgali]
MSSKPDHRLQNEEEAYPDFCSRSEPLSKEEIFHLLSTSRRRDVIQYLLETGDQVRLPTLATYIAAVEHETSVSDVTQAQYQRIYIPLYQSHLPKLDEAGVIRYNSSCGRLEPTERLNVFAPYLGLSPLEKSNAQSRFETPGSDKQAVNNWYLVAAGLSAILLLAVTLGLIPISGEFLGGIIIALFLATNAVTRL